MPQAYTVNGTIDFSGFTWNKIDWDGADKNSGLYNKNVLIENNNLVLSLHEGSGIGSQVESVASNYHYGQYTATIKAVPPTISPEGVCQGFFYYHDDNSEIDVEILSKDPGFVYFTVQGGEYFRILVPNQSTQYHEYGFSWTNDQVEFLLDGEVVATTKENIPDKPGYIILNNWSGVPDWSGYPPQGDRMLDMYVQSVSFGVEPVVPSSQVDSVTIYSFNPEFIVQNEITSNGGTISGSGSGTVTYHWEYRESGGSWQSLPNRTTSMSNGNASIPPEMVNNNGEGTWYYRVVVTSPNSVTSNEVQVAVRDWASIFAETQGMQDVIDTIWDIRMEVEASMECSTLTTYKSILESAQDSAWNEMKALVDAHEWCLDVCDVEWFVKTCKEKIAIHVVAHGAVSAAKLLGYTATTAKIALAAKILAAGGAVILAPCGICYVATSWLNPVFISAWTKYMAAEYGVKMVDLALQDCSGVVPRLGLGPTLPGNENPSQDLDFDGTYEDVDGSGKCDFDDVVMLFEEIDSHEIWGNTSYYDFNSNERIDFNDVVTLSERVVQIPSATYKVILPFKQPDTIDEKYAYEHNDTITYMNWIRTKNDIQLVLALEKAFHGDITALLDIIEVASADMELAAYIPLEDMRTFQMAHPAISDETYVPAEPVYYQEDALGNLIPIGRTDSAGISLP